MDEVKRAILFVYSQIASYVVVVIAALTLFKIAFGLSVPFLGLTIFLALFLSHLLVYYMLKAPLREAGMLRMLYIVLAFYLAMMLVSLSALLAL